jgi:hypothetical protein
VSAAAICGGCAGCAGIFGSVIFFHEIFLIQFFLQLQF